MSGYTDQQPPEQVEESTPNQAIPSNIAQAPPPIVDLSDDRKAWDTIILCSLLPNLSGRPMSPTQIADAINVRDRRTAAPIGPNSVTHMLEMAQSPSTRKRYPGTCKYEKWKGVRERLAARNGVKDVNDKEMEKAFLIFSDTVRVLNLIKLSGVGVAGWYV